MTADDLASTLERLKAGSRDEADIQAIAAAIATGKLILANAPGAVLCLARYAAANTPYAIMHDL